MFCPKQQTWEMCDHRRLFLIEACIPKQSNYVILATRSRFETTAATLTNTIASRPLANKNEPLKCKTWSPPYTPTPNNNSKEKQPNAESLWNDQVRCATPSWQVPCTHMTYRGTIIVCQACALLLGGAVQTCVRGPKMMRPL